MIVCQFSFSKEVHNLDNAFLTGFSMPIDGPFRQRFGTRLKALRKQQRWTQKEFAAKLGISVNHVSKYESGVHLPSAEKLVLLAELFNTTMDYLVFGSVDHQDHVQDTRLLQRLKALEDLGPKDQEAVFQLIDAMIFRNKVQGVVSHLDSA